MKFGFMRVAFFLGTLASPASAAIEEVLDHPVLKNAQMAQELRSRAGRLGTSAGNSDTTWIGYTPSAVSAANWWGVYAGFGKDGYYRPVNGVPHKGTWDWETPVHGDSLQGWWPLINLYASTGGNTRTDRNRPWWALDFGNMANYRINQTNGRTFGVLGVWHRDRGWLATAPAGKPTPEWTPRQGSFSAWMGVRAHGDTTYTDPITKNAFNEDVLIYTGFGAVSASGNDQCFPGYGSQMDQMLYHDIDVSGSPSANLTIAFSFRTVMSLGAGTTASTRTGWFDSDPLGVTSGPANPQPNNFISSSDAGDALAPRDSFMVYLGAGVENNTWIPAAANFGQNFPAQQVYDKQRRWFGEVLHWDRDPGSPPSAPRPLYYKELLSVAGNWPASAESISTPSAAFVDTQFTIPNSVLAPMLTKNNRLRLVFRVKTNRGFDDQGTAYTSNQRGAAVVDRVIYQVGANPSVTVGDFENPTDIDNDPNVSALAAWKSTGKPPGIFHHVHVFSDLVYEDLCGQKGDISRQCNMSGVVISAGDHDHGEAAGGLVDGTADRERNDGIMSPTIQFCGPYDGSGGTNRHGLKAAGSGPGDVDADEDIYLWYDIYTAVMDPFSKGNLWRYGYMSYPGNSKDPDFSGPQLPYPAWGQMRFPGFLIFNPDPQCLIDWEPGYQQALIKTSNTNAIPDSIKVFVGKQQQCFRFGVSAACSPTDGCYFDNVSFSIIDGRPAPVTADIWQWINDAFPANETPGLPGTASFDTAAAHLKTGLNIAQSTNNNLRFDVPGDSTVLTSSGAARMDLAFRILPGPGNYEPVGRPDLGTIVRRPDSRAVVTKGDGSFWDQYRQTPGDFASPSAVVLHHSALGGWDPNVWNSARCDTAERNLFARQTALFGDNVLGGPFGSFDWMATYHESDPHYATLGVSHNRCFVTSLSAPSTSVVCDGTVPSYVSSRPEHSDVTGTTKEGTKILPDGLLTPGAHVEYFFRVQTSSATPGAMSGMCPDTSIVLQLATEGSTDGHRWQEFGVLPNAWKKPTYFHPVTREFGHGPACLLVIDGNDRRGNERVWVGVCDTAGFTPRRYWGAHNGWHAGGGGDVDDPADNRRSDGQPGFTVEHLGQPGSGSGWDMYQVKAAESLSTGAGSLGSRRANRTGGAGQQIVIDKSSRQGPTPEMLNLYTMILYLSGDLNSGVLGPYSNRSANDAGLLIGWLNAGNSSFQNRAFWAIGDGFVESNVFGAKAITTDLMLNYLGTDLLHWNYIQYSGNTDELGRLRLLPGWQNKGASQIQLFGVRNLCVWTNDVLAPGGVGLPTLATVASEYDRNSSPNGAYLAPASVFKDWDPTSPYKTLVDGWDLEHLTNMWDVSTFDRIGYFYKLFANVWAKSCNFLGDVPVIPLDVPTLDGAGLADFVALRGNPMASGRATVHFGLARADRVEIKLYDVSGRLVRTLADRRFTAGEHDLVWDGLDDARREVARGVYFTRVRYREGGFTDSRKVTVLR
jgi:hypothetical protein